MNALLFEYNHQLNAMLKRYLLTFTLALISCIGTNYIHTLSQHGEEKSKSQLSEDFLSEEDVVYQETSTMIVRDEMI